jgi:hypothetical protein
MPYIITGSIVGDFVITTIFAAFFRWLLPEKNSGAGGGSYGYSNGDCTLFGIIWPISLLFMAAEGIGQGFKAYAKFIGSFKRRPKSVC